MNFVALFPDKTIFHLGEDVYELHDEDGFPATIEINLIRVSQPFTPEPPVT
jgi:hypothetical protein